MTKIGDKFTLWRTERKQNAYTDQYGISHVGYVVEEEVIVTVINVRHDVPGMFGSDVHTGWKAKSESGEELLCNWDQFPDDSHTPTYYWWASSRMNRPHQLRLEDAVQSINFNYTMNTPVLDKNGELYKLSGHHIDYCIEHSLAYYTNDETSCWKCKYL
jgi:hypothetical protein